MFSDSTQLIGNNPWFEDLANSMENFDEIGNSYLRKGILTDELIAELRSYARIMQTDRKAKDKLYDFLNKNDNGEYLTYDKAVELHQALLYKNVFNSETWNNLMPLIDVFYFYDACYKLITYMSEEFVGYEGMFPRLAKEMLKGGLLSLKLFDDFDTYKQEVLPKIDELQDGEGIYKYYKNAVKFIAESIIEFCETWKDCLPAVHNNIFLWLGSYYNPHYESSYFL